MKECSKSIVRRLNNPDFVRKYFSGHGLDIGGKPDPLSLYSELFPMMKSVKTWDIEDGDAQSLEGIEDGSLDFIHSSHCLEHLIIPEEGLKNWFRVLKKGGYLIVTVPDEDLYEQGKFPSTYNSDHKWTFTIYKEGSWSNKSINIIDIIKSLGKYAQIVKIQLVDFTYRYNLPRYDQTLTPISESSIEFIIRKRTDDEVNYKGLAERSAEVSRDLRIHLNQYKDDLRSLKENNNSNPPFCNDKKL